MRVWNCWKNEREQKLNENEQLQQKKTKSLKPKAIDFYVSMKLPICCCCCCFSVRVDIVDLFLRRFLRRRFSLSLSLLFVCYYSSRNMSSYLLLFIFSATSSSFSSFFLSFVRCVFCHFRNLICVFVFQRSLQQQHTQPQNVDLCYIRAAIRTNKPPQWHNLPNLDLILDSEQQKQPQKIHIYIFTSASSNNNNNKNY